MTCIPPPIGLYHRCMHPSTNRQLLRTTCFCPLPTWICLLYCGCLRNGPVPARIVPRADYPTNALRKIPDPDADSCGKVRSLCGNYQSGSLEEACPLADVTRWTGRGLSPCGRYGRGLSPCGRFRVSGSRTQGLQRSGRSRVVRGRPTRRLTRRWRASKDLDRDVDAISQ